MAKYINADAFKSKYLVFGYIEMNEAEFDSFAAADVKEVKHGEWIYSNIGEPRCSECGESAVDGIITPYCPHCGAKFDDEGQNDD